MSGKRVPVVIRVTDFTVTAPFNLLDSFGDMLEEAAEDIRSGIGAALADLCEYADLGNVSVECDGHEGTSS